MARVNVCLLDDLAQRARAAGVSISAISQDALRATLASANTDRWLDHLEQQPSSDLSHDLVMRALDDVRAELAA